MVCPVCEYDEFTVSEDLQYEVCDNCGESVEIDDTLDDEPAF